MSGENPFGHRDPVEGEGVDFTRSELEDAHGLEPDGVEAPMPMPDVEDVYGKEAADEFDAEVGAEADSSEAKEAA